jgi:alginate O-acetyltransferase complex protein AlgJ
MKSCLRHLLPIALASLTGHILPAFAADPAPGIIGKNEWLFYRYEISEPKDSANSAASIDLIARLNQVLARNNVTLAVVMVPLKMRIYSEHLPAEPKLTDYMAGNYERLNKALRAAQVHTIDLNSAFLQSPLRTAENPLFMRLDTHWAPAGALLAAETIRAGIDADPALKAPFASVPEEKFSLAWSKKKIVSKGRDLVAQLPPGSPAFGPEQLLPFSVARNQAAKEGLLGEEAAPGIVVVGSSYSDNWTGFTEALRFTLQRDLLDISVGAERGSWYGIESYLRDAAYQTQKPKLLIWEMPERDMKALPNYQYRDQRYISDNTEWLLRAASWAEGSNCQASPVKAKLAASAFDKGAPSKDGDAIEIEFDQPLDKLDYLSAQLVSNGSKQLTLEASGASVRKFSYPIADDNAAHLFKLPLTPANGPGFTKVKLLPGKSRGFSIKDVRVCRLPESLLK